MTDVCPSSDMARQLRDIAKWLERCQTERDTLSARVQQLREATECAIAAIDLLHLRIRDEPEGDMTDAQYLSALNSSLAKCREALEMEG